MAITRPLTADGIAKLQRESGLNYVLDHTEHSAVIVCVRPGCDWRYVAVHAVVALRKYARHVRAAHNDDVAANRVLDRATRKAV